MKCFDHGAIAQGVKEKVPGVDMETIVQVLNAEVEYLREIGAYERCQKRLSR